MNVNGLVDVHDGVYDETVLVNKTGVTLHSVNLHQAQIKPTTGAQQTVVSVNATGVTIDGGWNDDHLTGGPGRDTITGGGGDDTIDLRDGESDGLADCSDGNDALLRDPIDTAWLDCEAVTP